MITAIDTNILVDVIGGLSDLYGESSSLLERHSNKGSLIISPIAYSELLAVFLKQYDEHEAGSMLAKFLSDTGIRIFEFAPEDFKLAAKAWREFTSTRQLICSKCGAVNAFSCKKCGAQMSWRNHILTDFLIGAHAQNHADTLLTRDKSHYKKYFKVKILP